MRWRWANVGLPLLSKELAEMAQLRRTYAVRGAFAVLIYLTSALFFVPLYWALQHSPQGFLGHGADVLDLVYAIEWGGLVLFVPAIVSGALTAEKERNTLQLLFLTKLGPWTIVFEKLLSRLVPVATFLLVSLPLLFIAYLLGGLTQGDLARATAELVLMAFQLAAIALFCSAFCATSASAFILAYVLTAVVLLFPFLVYLDIVLQDWISMWRGAGHAALYSWLDLPQNHDARVTLLTSTLGLNLQWVFEQQIGPRLVRPFHTTPTPYVVIWTIGTLFVFLARSAVVRRASPQPKHRVRRMFAWLDARFTRLNDRYGKGILITSPDSGLPEADPVAWREKRRGNLGRINYLIRVLLVLEFPLLVISVLAAAFGSDHHFTTLGTIGLLLWPIAILLVIVRAAGLIAAEKARQTLDVLLATPLSLTELAGSKLRGLGRLKVIIAIPIIFQTLLITWLRLAVGRVQYPYGQDQRQVLATGGDAFLFLLITGLNIVILFSLAGQLAFLFGLYAKTQGRAVTATLGVFVGFCFVPLIVRLAIDDNWARDLMYLSPIADILVNEFPRLGVEWSRGGLVLGVRGEEWQFYPILHCALFAMIVGTLAAINRRLSAQVLLRPTRNQAVKMSLRDAAKSFARLAILTIGLFAFVTVARPETLSAADRRDNLDHVLAKIRSAVGYRSLQKHPAGVLVEGVAEVQGLHGPYTLAYTPDGKFLQTLKLKRDLITGYDGTTSWARDWSGTPRVLELEEFESQQMLFAVRTGRWLAEGGPVHVAMSHSTGAANEIRLRLQLARSHESAELTVSRATWLPSRLTMRRLGTVDSWEFADYRPALGMTLAYRTVHRIGGAADTFEIHAVHAAPSTGQDSFRPALEPPHDLRFDAATPATFEVKQAPSGHLFVRPKVNGQEVGWFALDTGSAGMTIAPAVADRLGMPAFGKVVYGGAGKLAVGKLHEGKTFQLGSVTLDGGIYLELPQAFCDAMKRLMNLEIVGTCGYDLLSRVVLEVDLKNSTAACFEPAGYKLAKGDWEPLAFNQKIPCVRVKFEGGREDLFQLDTGAGANVLFHASAVEKLKLLDGRATKPIKVGGVGGTLDARYGPLGWFEVGGQRLEGLPAIFLARHEGALDQAYVAGTFGSGILKGMKIVFDYPHRRIAFVK